MSLVIGFLYLWIRISAITMIAPILGHKSVGPFIRLGLACLIAMILAPGVLPEFANSVATSEPANVVSNCLSEAIVGTTIGLGMLVIFSTAMMIGSSIAHMSGLQIESVFGNDSGFGQHPTTQLIGLTAACVFILFGGLEIAISTAMTSFQALPIAESISMQNAADLITKILHQSFELTIRAVAPAVASLLVSTILVGIISRTLPQLNIVQVGLSTNVGLMLTAAFLTLGGCVWLVIDDFERVNELINHSLSSLHSAEP